MTAAITDFTQYTELRTAAGRDDPAALREVAGQFEALFLQTMLKNMREASIGDPLFGDNEEHKMFQGMMDQQLSLEMASGKGIGLADMLVRQLGTDSGAAGPRKAEFDLTDASRAARAASVGAHATLPTTITVSETGIVPATSGSAIAIGAVTPSVAPVDVAEKQPDWSNAEKFVQDIWPHAKRVAQRLSVAPVAVIAQAALETGWGAHVMQHKDGNSSFNLFGIKAGGSWSGESVVRSTLEFEAGVPKREMAQFRAYKSLAQNFDDYAQLLTKNPRYATVSGHGEDVAGFATALQASGYATDPAYADKIKRIAQSDTMKNVISSLKNETFRPITTRLLAESM